MPGLQSFHDELVWGRGGALGSVLRPALWLASKVYRGAIGVRNARYDRGDTVRRLDVPVISVGNITTGGTGKTPMVIDLVNRLRAMGCEPAVVSRGYKAAPNQLGDELWLVQRAASGTVCVANPDRVAGAKQARKAGADVIVLDDGFQHRRIARDLDIVLVDATRPFGGGHLLPRGHLREPLPSLARADLLVITRADQVEAERLSELETRLVALSQHKPCVCARHAPAPLQMLSGETASAVNSDDLNSVYLLSGIGHHDAFRQTVDRIGLSVCGHDRFGDHHPYTAEDVHAVCGRARDAGADAVLTTAKDAVKLVRLRSDWVLPVRVLDVRIDFLGEGGKIVDQLLTQTTRGVKAEANEG